MLPLLGAVALGGCSHQSSNSPFSTTSNHNAPARIGSPPSSTPEAEPANLKAFTTEVGTDPEPDLRRDPEASDIDDPVFGITVGSETSISNDTPAAPARQTLANVLRHSLKDNPDIGIASAQEQDEAYAIEVARAQLRPQVNLRLAHGPENYINESDSYLGSRRSEFGIDLRQTLYDFGRADYNVARRKALHNSAGYRRLNKMNQVSFEVSRAYFRILEASEQIRVAEKNLAAHQELKNLVTASQEAGNASVADVKRVATRLERARTALIDLRSRKNNAEDDYHRITGLEPGHLSPPIHLKAPLPPRGISREQYPDNPELLSVRADIDSLRFQVKSAKANMMPTIDLDVSGSVKNDVAGPTGTSRDFKGLLSFNYKLLDGNARVNSARQILARITENKHRYRKKRREYVHSLENAIRTVRSSIEKAGHIRTQVADSQKVLELYKAQFKDGNRSVFELLDALSELYTARTEKISNRYAKLSGIYEIHSLRGDLVARLLMNKP